MNTGVISKKQLVLALLGLFVLIIGLIGYDSLTFRLKSTDPERTMVDTVTPYISFTFSQPVESVDEVTLSGDGKTIELERDITDKTIKVNFPTTLVEDAEYIINLKGIHSKWFDGVITQERYVFTPQYRDLNDMSKEQQQALLNQSDSGQIDDPFLNNQFPLATDEFYVDVSHPEGSDILYVEVIILAEVFSPDTNTQAQVSNDKAEDIHAKAMELIKKHGGTPDKYVITYSNVYLNEKYGDIKQD